MWRRFHFEYIAATGYLIGHLTLIFKGALFEQSFVLPSLREIKSFDPTTYQSLAGLSWLAVSITLYFSKKHPVTAIKICAALNYTAYVFLIMSGITREAFLIHIAGILPWFFAATLMFQGNKLNDSKNIFRKYPVAIAGFIFASGLLPVIYSAWVNQDQVMVFVGIIWIIANISFALTDLNFRQKLGL
jgi:hypothetical protein